MIELWYALLVMMLTIFLVLDGWNFGAGLLHFVVGKNELERRQVISAIGPLWSWHEVWLVGFGGVLFVSFPNVMATAFAGFYLALFLLLWTLILRGASIEVRGHLPDPMWRLAWDFGFALASLILAVLVGVALGNVVRGVPLDETGRFTLSFFTHFGVRGRVGILDWYTLSVAVFSVNLLAAHGASYLTLKTSGIVHDRSEQLARWLWPTFAVVLLILTGETAYVRPDLIDGLRNHAAAWPGVVLVIGGLTTVMLGLIKKREQQAFIGSCVTIVGLMSAGAGSVFPVMLHSTLTNQYTLTAYNGASDGHSLKLALIWWPFAFVFAFTYFIFISRNYRGKVQLDADTQGY